MVDKIVGRIMLTLGLMIFLALFTYQAQARTVSIFDVRQNLPLTNSEPVYRDFYINGGTDVGFQVGMLVSVERRISLHDSFQNQSPGALRVETGKVQIIHVQENVSVARLRSVPSHENYPVVETNTVMIGDTINMMAFKKGLETRRLKKSEAERQLLALQEKRKKMALRSAPEKPKRPMTVSYNDSFRLPVRPVPPVVIR